MMTNTIEMTSVENLVKDSETVTCRDTPRKFEYKMNDKAAKGKLLKGAKRNPFEVVENSSSSNLVFNPGSWNYVVLPSIRYWYEVKGSKTCRIGELIVKMEDIYDHKNVSSYCTECLNN